MSSSQYDSQSFRALGTFSDMSTDGIADTTSTIHAIVIGSFLMSKIRARVSGMKKIPMRLARNPSMIDMFAPEIENGTKSASPQNEITNRYCEDFWASAFTADQSPIARENRWVSSNASVVSKFAL